MQRGRIKITATLYRYGFRSELWCDITEGRKWTGLSRARKRRLALEVWQQLRMHGVDKQIGEVIISAWSWDEWALACGTMLTLIEAITFLKTGQINAA